MDGAMLARLFAIVFIAFTVTVVAMNLARKDEPAAAYPAQDNPPRKRATDALRTALARCQEMGEAATHDPSCLATWAESRRRFLRQAQGR